MRTRTIITGASGALGREVVAALVRRGDHVVAIDRAVSSDFAATVHQLTCGDLANEGSSEQVMGQALAVLGTVDALILIAGAFSSARVDKAGVALWREMFHDNLETTLAPLRAALPGLAEGASIICVGAHAAEAAGQGMAPYAASKSAVARLVEALAIELKERKIRVNAVLPAIIDTPRNRRDMPDADFASWTSPTAIAEVIEFLSSDSSRAINGALVRTTNAA